MLLIDLMGRVRAFLDSFMVVLYYGWSLLEGVVADPRSRSRMVGWGEELGGTQGGGLEAEAAT